MSAGKDGELGQSVSCGRVLTSDSKVQGAKNQDERRNDGIRQRENEDENGRWVDHAVINARRSVKLDEFCAFGR